MKLKPSAPACERNRKPILQVIKPVLSHSTHLLEIGSGTGEHGVFFAEEMRWLRWQCSDLMENIEGINLWIEEAKLENLPKAIELDVSTNTFSQSYDAFFTANSLHIMSEKSVHDFFSLIAKRAVKNSELLIYGPFNYDGKFTSESNANFELWLKQRNPLSGIRDFEWIVELANTIEFKLVNDYAMPANNRCLHFSNR